LIKYFLASLTIPENDLWVNLSPYEKNRIVPGSFGLTEMGRDLLAQDYMLKQITASLIYPEGETGKKFWNRIYAEAAKRFGTTNIPVNTFNKVWIVPEKAVVYENAQAGTVYVVEAKLKVMLEEDYLSQAKHEEIGDSPQFRRSGTVPDLGPQIPNSVTVTNSLGSQIVRQIVIPELNKEVNYGQNFAQLRQVYNSLILATWYKKKIKDSILAQVYEDKNKIQGLVIPDFSDVIPAKAGIHNKNDVEYIYQQYLQAFKKGVYNYIKEDIDPATQQTIPRKYFSGGVTLLAVNNAMRATNAIPTGINDNNLEIISSEISMSNMPTMRRPIKLRTLGSPRAMGSIPSNNMAMLSGVSSLSQQRSLFGKVRVFTKRVGTSSRLMHAINEKEFADLKGSYNDFLHHLEKVAAQLKTLHIKIPNSDLTVDFNTEDFVSNLKDKDGEDQLVFVDTGEKPFVSAELKLLKKEKTLDAYNSPLTVFGPLSVGDYGISLQLVSSERKDVATNIYLPMDLLKVRSAVSLDSLALLIIQEAILAKVSADVRINNDSKGDIVKALREQFLDDGRLWVGSKVSTQRTKQFIINEEENWSNKLTAPDVNGVFPILASVNSVYVYAPYRIIEFLDFLSIMEGLRKKGLLAISPELEQYKSVIFNALGAILFKNRMLAFPADTTKIEYRITEASFPRSNYVAGHDDSIIKIDYRIIDQLKEINPHAQDAGTLKKKAILYFTLLSNVLSENAHLLDDLIQRQLWGYSHLTEVPDFSEHMTRYFSPVFRKYFYHDDPSSAKRILDFMLNQELVYRPGHDEDHLSALEFWRKIMTTVKEWAITNDVNVAELFYITFWIKQYLLVDRSAEEERAVLAILSKSSNQKEFLENLLSGVVENIDGYFSLRSDLEPDSPLARNLEALKEEAQFQLQYYRQNDRFPEGGVFDQAQQAEEVKLNTELDQIIQRYSISGMPRWISPISYVQKFAAILKYALLNDNPNLIDRMEAEVLPQLRALKEPLMTVLPVMDAWLFEVSMEGSEKYLDMARGLAILKNRPLASALLFAANGPHTRGEFNEIIDKDDIEAQGILINGFIGHLKRQLDMLKVLEKSDKRYPSIEAEARKYAGALCNGLLMRTHLDIEGLITEIESGIEDQSIKRQFRGIIGQSARLFPEKMPDFMHFIGKISGTEDVGLLMLYNKNENKQITAEQHFLGVPSEDADRYREKVEPLNREELRIVPSIEETQEDYKYLRDLPDEAMDVRKNGGIDFTPARMDVQVKTRSPTEAFGDDKKELGNDIGIKFHLDPAMLRQLQNAPGFVPVIINMQPMHDLRKFLGVPEKGGNLQSTV